MKVIGQCHQLLHENGIVRIQSDIRVGSRTDKKQSFTDKVAAVEKLLQADGQGSVKSNVEKVLGVDPNLA